MTSKTSKKSAEVVREAAAKRVATKAAKPRKAVAKSSDDMSASKRIDKKIGDLDDWRGETLAEIRKLIHDVDPEVDEEWKWMRTPVWSHEGMYALANAHKDKVKLTFFHGAELPDPRKLFNAGLGGNKWRAIDFRDGDEMDKAALKALLREAVAYNARHSVPKSRGSRERVPSRTRPNAAKRPSRVVKGRPTAARPKGAAGKGERSAATKSKDPLLAAKPVLLAGGNPQIAKADGDAPVQAYIGAMPGWTRDVGRRLDALIVRTVPGVRKAVKWNSPFYGIEGQGWLLNFHCFAKYVKVAFFRGTSLRPLPPGESKHKEVRYLDIHEDDHLDEELVGSWIRQASELPGWVP